MGLGTLPRPIFITASADSAILWKAASYIHAAVLIPWLLPLR